MSTPVFVLVDCNNFFASCERVFRPDLIDKPVAVLSNNDGCIVARSNEVKDLGVPMAAPEFEHRAILNKHHVTLFSANFALYADLSRRIVEILKGYTPDIEVYSIDESFLEVGSLKIDDFTVWGKQIRERILRWTGVPVSIGIASSKTLAKAATDLAKADKNGSGVMSLVGLSETALRQRLANLPLEDIWGIGWRTAPRLRQAGIRSAADLAAATPKWARQNLTIRGERTVRELNGQACYQLSQSHAEDGQKSMAVTRTFRRSAHAAHALEEPIASFAAKAAEKLRGKQQIAGAVAVFIRTSAHARQQFGVSHAQSLPYPTADTSVIVQNALEVLQAIHHPEHSYKKAGVIMLELRPATAQQTTLAQTGAQERLAGRDRLMRTLDGINVKYGSHTLRTAAQGHMTSVSDKSLHERRSPAYTTSWSDIRVIG
jgi:DNA polymerase V